MENPHMKSEPNNEETLPCLPLEIIENLIIPHSALPWLRVSKKYNKYALKYAADDSSLLMLPDISVRNTIRNQNYALLDVLLADRRYTEAHMISYYISLCSFDRIASLLLLQRCIGKLSTIKTRILAAAVRENWLEVVEYAFNHEDDTIITISFSSMFEEVFNFVISHPKLKWNENYTSQLLENDKIPESTKFKILSLPDIDLSQVISRLYWNVSTFLDVLAEDQRVLNNPNLQRALWSKMIELGSESEEDVLYDRIKRILDKKLLDPSIDFNLPLRFILGDYHIINKRKIAQLLLDDDRVVLTVEPFDKNLIMIAIIGTLNYAQFIEQFKWILSQPKFKREWFEITARHLLFDKLKDMDYENFRTKIIHPEFIFKDHQFDEYLSEEIRAMERELMKPFIRYFRKRDAFLDGHINPDSVNSDNDE